MNYIVLDLEWNQSNTRQEKKDCLLRFEIIEIGAIKLNDECVMISEFSELVKPQVYHEMHHFTSQLIHMQIQELERGRSFTEVMQDFLEWCGEEEYVFCTWGGTDLTEIQKNMKFYDMTLLSEGPIAFLDVQKLFSIAYEDRKQRRTLEYAIDYLSIEKDIPFHRAFSDAYYTAKVLACLIEIQPEVLKNVSYDVFNPPKERKDEIRAAFDTYVKYISRTFDSKMDAFADKEVSSSKCYICHRNLRKKLKWFSVNGRHYYSVAYCEKHGYLKGKVRVYKTDEGRVYVVKTNKFVSKEEADSLAGRKGHAKELRRNRKQKKEKQQGL